MFGRLKTWLKIMLLALGPSAYFLGWITAFCPQQVEYYYAMGFAREITRYLSIATGIVPFSVAEILVWLLILGLAIYLSWSVSAIVKEPIKIWSYLGNSLLKLIVIFGLVFFSFQITWGLNYNRVSFAEIAGLEVTDASEEELVLLCTKLVEKANKLREGLPEDETGVLKIEEGFAGAREKAHQAFILASDSYSELSGNFGLAKPVFFSKLMSYTGITGIYFPFTGEANVNIDIPDCILPATICHEMAHQRGFAREDECNYIAWLVCNKIEDPVFQYSGTILALSHSLNALSKVNSQSVAELKNRYSAGVKRDLTNLASYWSKYDGKIEQIASDINDTYLKSNRQQDGIRSYGRMVDLLLAEQRER